jgi:ketosteroid isomerase-like protein
MSQENVEVVRRGLEAAARNDWNEVMASVDPSIEWVEMPSLGPDASTYTGMDELREAISSWMGMWSQYDAEVVRYADAGDDVVVLFRERGHGGVSGAAVERELGEVFTLRDGKVMRVRLYGSWADALEAVGVRE